MSDVRLRLHGQPTQVDARLARLERDEVAHLPGRRVVDPDAHQVSLSRAAAVPVGARQVVAGLRRCGDEGAAVTQLAYRRRVRVRALPTLATLAVAPLVLSSAVGTAGGRRRRRPPQRPITYTAWDTAAELSTGSRSPRCGSRRTRCGSTPPAGPAATPAAAWDFGRWTSRWTAPGFAFTELVPSWEATHARRHVRRGPGPRPRRRRPEQLGHAGPVGLRRRRLPPYLPGPQADDLARVATDTFVANGSFDSWQLRVTLNRAGRHQPHPAGRRGRRDGVADPVVDRRVPPAGRGVARGVTLPVPSYSQMVHDGDYPQYDGGGEAWCSPTSTSMVLGYYGALPAARPTTPGSGRTTPTPWSTTSRG